MKLYLIIMGYMLFGAYLCADEDTEYFEPDEFERFYLEPRIEYEGHLWKVVLMKHHPECPCRD